MGITPPALPLMDSFPELWWNSSEGVHIKKLNSQPKLWCPPFSEYQSGWHRGLVKPRLVEPTLRFLTQYSGVGVEAPKAPNYHKFPGVAAGLSTTSWEQLLYANSNPEQSAQEYSLSKSSLFNAKKGDSMGEISVSVSHPRDMANKETREAIQETVLSFSEKSLLPARLQVGHVRVWRANWGDWWGLSTKVWEPTGEITAATKQTGGMSHSSNLWETVWWQNGGHC